MIHRFVWFFLTLSLYIAPVAASDLFRYGWMPTVSSYALNDPSGPTESKSTASLLSLIAIFDFGRDDRIFANIRKDTLAVEGTTANIGQNYVGTGANISYQTMLRLGREFKPWVGLGMGYNSETYKDRYKLTPGGFNTCPSTCFSDRVVDNYVVVVNASNDWKLSREWNMGVHFQYEKPVASTGANSFRFGLYFTR